MLRYRPRRIVGRRPESRVTINGKLTAWSQNRITAGEMTGRRIDGIMTGAPLSLTPAASRGKQVRAEPIAALYEQGKVHHIGTFARLEDEMTQWDPSMPDSPNRMDALVWALTELSTGGEFRVNQVLFA